MNQPRNMVRYLYLPTTAPKGPRWEFYGCASRGLWSVQLPGEESPRSVASSDECKALIDAVAKQPPSPETTEIQA